MREMKLFASQTTFSLLLTIIFQFHFISFSESKKFQCFSCETPEYEQIDDLKKDKCYTLANLEEEEEQEEEKEGSIGKCYPDLYQCYAYEYRSNNSTLKNRFDQNNF